MKPRVRLVLGLLIAGLIAHFFGPDLLVVQGFDRPFSNMITLWSLATFTCIVLALDIARPTLQVFAWLAWITSFYLHLSSTRAARSFRYVSGEFIQDPEPFRGLIIGIFAAALIVSLIATAKRNRAVTWLIVSVCLAAVLGRAGSDGYGISPMVTWLHNIGLDWETANNIVVPLRKLIHVLFFGSLGVTAWWAVRNEMKPMHAIAASSVWVLCQAAFDEYRQSTMIFRTGIVFDVILDVASALVFVISLHFWANRRKSEAHPAIPA